MLRVRVTRPAAAQIWELVPKNLDESSSRQNPLKREGRTAIWAGLPTDLIDFAEDMRAKFRSQEKLS